MPGSFSATEGAANNSNVNEIRRIGNKPGHTYTQSYIKNGEVKAYVTGILMVVPVPTTF